MVRLLCDENFNGKLIAALTARFPDWVIAYYLRHREAVDGYLAGWDRQADELQRQIEAT